jgi:putative transport protein
MHSMQALSIAVVTAPGTSIAADLAILSLAICLGLALGNIRFGSLRIGVSGALFSALAFGQVGFTIDARVLDFLKDFALIMFMYILGLQIGPGFVASLRRDGIRLNALAACVMGLGAIISAALIPLLPPATAPGLFAGAFITTPGLATIQETLRESTTGSSQLSTAAQSSLAYSITYPFGVIGPMLVVVAFRSLFKVRIDEERTALAQEEAKRSLQIATLDVEVTAPTHVGKSLSALSAIRDGGIVLTRVLRDKVATVATAQTVVQLGDVYRALGPRQRLDQFVAALGHSRDVDFANAKGDVQRADILVTRTRVLHRSLSELQLPARFGVTIAKVNRVGVDLMPTGSLRLGFADQVLAVGPKEGLRQAAAELGNSTDRLSQTQLIPIFLGIVLGVGIGSLPLVIPGMTGSLRIGLAGGSLLAAILLARLGSIGSIVWYMPAAANQLFRDFGMAIFLACIGFKAGDHFVQRAAQNSGLLLIAWGALLTTVPVFLVGCFARVVLRMNFVVLSGWVAGSMGSSAALPFVEELTSSKLPSTTYATVLPLAELMPIICAQLLAITALRH